MEDFGTDDPVSQYVHLGSVFFAIAIVVWTSVAVWLCYSGPSGSDLDSEGNTDLSDSVVGQVANSFAVMLVESKERGGRPLDLSKLEELLATGHFDPKGTDRQSPEMAAFREQLREKLAASFFVNLSRKEDAATGSAEGAERAGTADRKAAGARREALEDFLKQLLHPPIGSLRGGEEKLGMAASAFRSSVRGPSGDDGLEKDGSKSATMLSMAEHARDIGNKYLQDRHFAAAAHCYKVACLLCHAGSSAPSRLAAYHCNCALACLELGRYGDVVNESNAALVLTPPKHLAVKALYRMAVAHANLRNTFEARRCLKRCLQLDPLNEYVRVFLSRLGEEEDNDDLHVGRDSEGRLVWVDPPKRVQSLGAVSRHRARGKRGKAKAGASETAEVRLDREAGLWHPVDVHAVTVGKRPGDQARRVEETKVPNSIETSSNSTAATNGRGAISAPASRDERIEMLLKDSGFDEDAYDDDDEPELSFEELLAQEKAFFQSGKLSFPRAG